MTEIGTVVMPKYDSVITFRDTHYEKLPQVEKDKVIAHQMQHVENELLLNKPEKDLQHEEEENKGEVADKAEDEIDEELVEFEDSQDSGATRR
jgi:hypothetical protein